MSQPMKNPPHPGRIIRQECIEPSGLTVTDVAKALGVSRNTLSELLNERRGISAEMAIRLSKAFGSAPETWAALQLDYDMAQAMKTADRIKVRAEGAAAATLAASLMPTPRPKI
jgi:antitoxin HigA-1